MSRRPDPTRAAQNQQTIKNLLKLEANKTCADCKRNKHPRWASWNIGVFVCIRCSGIHRGMGTHISRVKSVDLDAWTDEQLQSVLKWGNARANKYWEAKLTPGHVPSDSKIENFIRTKYESKRWAMDGPLPDPSSLGSDDDVPLAVVQEKAKLERSASQRAPVVSQPPVRRQAQQQPVDFFGDDNTINPPARPSTTDPLAVARPPPPGNAQPAAKQGKPAESLLGLDFFGSSQSTPTSRPGSTGPAAGSQPGVSRPDLKQSILSLYATAPKPQPAQHNRATSIGGSNQSNVGSLTDAFSGLTFPTNATSPPPKPQSQSSDAFAGLTGFGGPRSPAAVSQVTSPSSTTGSLFDSIASNNTASKPAAVRTASISSNGWDSFSQPLTSPSSQPKPPPPSNNLSHGLLDLSAPEPSKPTSPPVPQSATSPGLTSSVFNLSSPAAQPAQKAAPTTSTSNVNSVFSAAASMDPWGGNAWGNPEPTPAPAPAPRAAPALTTTTTTTVTSQSTSSFADSMRMPDTLTSRDIGAGWGAPSNPSKAAASVAPDDDFGGWTSAAPVSSSSTATSKPSTGGLGGGNDDLFSNVWE
ncbi:hypothetical protein BGW36DRAFT_310394 [Talaromyces proteolyticus]|uniref:Arf-GAP domain-containing protein n=1 Tax=Talaromyces proteolyticus TaxID=1131652 RepID=A0AAD4L0T8_9EURO|nr:uncharacterized protein BGW36DRAFT_310394 [Talaromyces proteolyticus]KAH8704999.1 hypothetical protein BGW36DRAFT_310394 [Talaromyces proteolyticus]